MRKIIHTHTHAHAHSRTRSTNIFLLFFSLAFEKLVELSILCLMSLRCFASNASKFPLASTRFSMTFKVIDLFEQVWLIFIAYPILFIFFLFALIFVNSL